MKRFFTITTIILLAATSNVLTAQNCDFAQTGVRYNYSNIDANGKCIINLDLYFDLRTNSGSKYMALHIWPTTAYPDLTYNNPPQSTDLAEAATIVIHHFQEHLELHSLYNPDTQVQPQYVGMSVTIGPTVTPGYDRFIVTNINLEVPGGCSIPQSFTIDMWSTESVSMNQVLCFDKGTLFYANNAKAIGLLNCNLPRTYNVQIFSIDPTPMTIDYKVYVDNGDNVFNKITDTLVIKSQSGIVISSASGYSSDYTSYLPYSNQAPYNNMNLWLEVTSPSLPNSVVALVENSCAALPVKLRSFEATKVGPDIRLDWVTTGEFDSKGFDIERRVGDRPWESVGFVNSRAPGGYSTTEISYSHIDHINLKEFVQYRLKQVDINGNFEYSEIRMVKNDPSDAITIFPNPTTGNVNIAFADQRMQYDVRIYNEGGQLVNKWHDCRATLTIVNLKPGLYIFKINEQFNKRVTTHKVIVMNKKG